jgi:tripartite-type tricarboxylate transporter receptor subunit TctC
MRLQRRMILAGLRMATLAITLAAASAWAAEDFPTKPVTLLIPVGAGGSHDLTARAMVSVIPQFLGQPMVIQLRPGGGGAIGSQQVASAKPDGYTVLFGGPGWSSALPAIEGRSVGPNGLVAVARVNYSPVVFIARPDAPFKTLKEMVEWAKANPGKLVHGNTGPWGAGDLPMKQMMKEYNFQAQIVPHDGGGPALLAILGGHIQTTIALTAQSMPHIKAGKLKVLAVLDTKRHPDLRDVPTSVEQGINVTYTIWRAVLAPKGTPRPVIDKLADAIKKTTEDKSFQALVKQLGDEPGYAGPDEFAKEWQKEYDLHKEIAKAFKK